MDAASDAGSTYRSLDRPVWAPPSWLFGPVWTVLYATSAVSAWLVLRRRSLAETRAEVVFWSAQLLLFRRSSRAASLLLVPCALWVLYAASLNFAIWRLNG
ncbi:tryptophan-rich sensory protein [Streptomyces sp. D2-8]|uniref:TspO/MBR family protein n=1 Tax=Streptomyces sp. D2-8 TaxID=2707767 RepID=UPI0020C06C55|nr:TspO/MBR family protein [Streptomyces sp. D2-8]MCK8433005.1 tryptophan-rich sensory protein [Streptomyces sp. D2-8]